MAIEEPRFTRTLQEGAFDIRDYQASVVAEVTVTGDQGQAANQGFRLLAGYIFGSNHQHKSLAMTAPVAQVPISQKIAMTAPVTQTPENGRWVVRFTMPSTFSLATLPVPDNPKVQLRETAPGRFAVQRFSGIADPHLVAAKTLELKAFIKTHRLEAIGPAALAQYDPPWTLWFLRRNAVMIQIAP